MSLEVFKQVFHQMPTTLTQIAFGIGDLDANPDLLNIMHYCRENTYQEIIPNITINGYNLTKKWVRDLVEVCGAVACSHYSDDECFNAVELLVQEKEKNPRATLRQVNIHQVLSPSTYEDCLSLLDKVKTDPRLVGLNAIVFLLFKPKGRGRNLPVFKDFNKYKALIDKAIENKVRFGFDSCSANSFLKAVENRPEYQQYLQVSEACESTCLSIYINVDAKVLPCSFSQGEPNIPEIDLLEVDDFVKEVWYNQEVKQFRENLLKNNRKCPLFNLEMEGVNQ